MYDIILWIVCLVTLGALPLVILVDRKMNREKTDAERRRTVRLIVSGWGIAALVVICWIASPYLGLLWSSLLAIHYTRRKQ